MAVKEVMNIQKVKVYSPTVENRTRFSQEFGKSLAMDIEPVPTAEEAVRNADIVIAATSSLEPVIHADWVKDGMHLISIRLPEFDSATLKKCTTWTASRIPGGLSVRNVSLAIGGVDKIPARDKDSIAPGIDPRTFSELAPLIANRESGRKSDKEITCFMIRGDTGMQFAAIAAKTIELARAKRMGRELPDEWFCQDYHP
jgi:ornithine cyclodeaminase/alanine dehydrogenase-like protein (mu-crystallin family)